MKNRKLIKLILFSLEIVGIIWADLFSDTMICPMRGKGVDGILEINCQVGRIVKIQVPEEIIKYKIDSPENWMITSKEKSLWIQPRIKGVRARLVLFTKLTPKKSFIYSIFLLENGTQPAIENVEILRIGNIDEYDE